jgi:predicted RNA-binding Zn ribbon-like protein
VVSNEDTFRFDLCGGQLAIDFSNTVSARHTAQPIERITSYDRLVNFAEQSGVLDTARAAKLRAQARRRPDDASRTLAEAIELRDALYAIFSGVASSRAPPARELEILNDRLTRLRLNEKLDWEWRSGAGSLDAMIGPITRAAVELLTADQRQRVRMCEADDCVWVFLDTSKNRTRRWCDMKQCGNRMKARRFHHRHG